MDSLETKFTDLVARVENLEKLMAFEEFTPLKSYLKSEVKKIMAQENKGEPLPLWLK